MPKLVIAAIVNVLIVLAALSLLTASGNQVDGPDWLPYTGDSPEATGEDLDDLRADIANRVTTTTAPTTTTEPSTTAPPTTSPTTTRPTTTTSSTSTAPTTTTQPPTTQPPTTQPPTTTTQPPTTQPPGQEEPGGDVAFTAFQRFGVNITATPDEFFQGTATPGSVVEISSPYGSVSATVDAWGSWGVAKLTMDGLPLGTQTQITVSAVNGSTTFTFSHEPGTAGG